MPTTVECNHSERRLRILRSGVFTIDDLIESVASMRATDVWSYSVLVDARHASTALVPAEARALVARIRSIGEGKERGPIAVVTENDITFGMVRMFAALAEPIGMRVGAFREMGAAEQWLSSVAQDHAQE